VVPSPRLDAFDATRYASGTLTTAFHADCAPGCGEHVGAERRHTLVVTRGTSQAGQSRRRCSAFVAVALVLCATAIVIAWVGSADPPIDVRNSAYWFRTLRMVPGVLNVCGDFTWAARAVPPALAVFGALSGMSVKPRTRVAVTITYGAVALAAVLLYATTQNAVPWGERGCVA